MEAMATAEDVTSYGDELWRECSQWLTNWGMIRQDHTANSSDSGVADIANVLRDGVMLCRLLNKIDPGCIDMKDVNMKPSMAQFLCLRNISLFLKTCVDNFGLKQSDLFEDVMLFELGNFHKVLCTLSKVSLSPKALRSRIQGFTAQKIRSKEEEVIYQSLRSVDLVRSHRDTSNDPGFDLTSEEIYQDLCVVRNAAEQPASLEKRDFVVKELFDTEKNYVDVLCKLKKNFMIPLLHQMKPEDHEIVFHKIKELHEIHNKFYQDLLRTPGSVSTVFMRWCEDFLMYGSYCANLTHATNLLQELCDNDETFNQAVIKHEKEVNNGRFKLRDVLSVPMQRILKYHLLLEKLIESTDVNLEEYNELRRARETMLDVAGFINEAARDSEHLAVIKNLQDTIVEWQHDDDLQLSNFGRLIKDAELKIKAHDDQKTRNRYVFIFDKCLLICKQIRGGQFAFRQILNITEYYVDEAHNRAILNKETRWSYHFLLVKSDNTMAYTMFVRTVELKQQIIQAIYEALDNNRPSTLNRISHKLELQTFSEPKQCFQCSKYLKGLVYQGYRCTSCRIAVHKSCIPCLGKCGAPRRFWHDKKVYGNVDEDEPLRGKLWFIGQMDRVSAEQTLSKRENGAFLIRISTTMQKEKYALSFKYKDCVLHMRVFCKREHLDESPKYYLSESKFFNTVEELVLNYENHCLKENFDKFEENTKLIWPYYRVKGEALRSFDTRERNELSLLEGESFFMVETYGYTEGWLKGRKVNGETGYFPEDRVKLEAMDT